MKTLSLWEPHASLIALGLKTVETRSWSTSYRGPLLIHAAKKWDAALKELAESWWPMADVLPHDWEPQLGKLVAVATLTSVYRMTPEVCAYFEHEALSCPDATQFTRYAMEWYYGDWKPGRFGWNLTDVRAIDPIPLRGAQGLWDVTDDAVLQAVGPVADVQERLLA